VVVGAHLSGEPLNHQLVERGGRLLRRTRTGPTYRLHRLAGSPERPTLVPSAEPGGRGFEAEVWELPPAGLGELVGLVPAPLALGQVELADGSRLPGFVYAGSGVDLGEDLSGLAGWRHRRS
jgi:allophanate hydrolase